MTGQAQTAYKQLSEATRATYAECKKGLRERFKPACKRDMYIAEFQARRKHRDEDWPSAVTLMREDLWDQAISTSTPSERTSLEPWNGPPLVGVEGTPLKVRGVAQASVSLADRTFEPNIVIVDDLSATFQRLMDLVLAGLQWSSCLVYLDDVIVTGRTLTEHLKKPLCCVQPFA